MSAGARPLTVVSEIDTDWAAVSAESFTIRVVKPAVVVTSTGAVIAWTLPLKPIVTVSLPLRLVTVVGVAVDSTATVSDWISVASVIVLRNACAAVIVWVPAPWQSASAAPLPARCGFWAVPRGVAVEVQCQGNTPALRQQITESLHAWGVPVQALHLLELGQPLRHPLPLRGDLREHSFAAPSPVHPVAR